MFDLADVLLPQQVCMHISSTNLGTGSFMGLLPSWNVNGADISF